MTKNKVSDDNSDATLINNNSNKKSEIYKTAKWFLDETHASPYLWQEPRYCHFIFIFAHLPMTSFIHFSRCMEGLPHSRPNVSRQQCIFRHNQVTGITLTVMTSFSSDDCGSFNRQAKQHNSCPRLVEKKKEKSYYLHCRR